jgi:hypothetical protein
MKLNKIGSWASIIGLPLAVIVGFIFWWWKKEDVEPILESVNISSTIIFGIIILTLVIWVVFLLVQSYKSKNKKRKIISYFEKYKMSNLGKEYIDKRSDKFLIKKTEKSIKDFVAKNTTKNLESDIYYLYLFSLLTGAEDKIWAVSVMGEEEWNESDEEKEFQRLNLEVENKHILLERIFVINKANSNKLKETRNVFDQIKKSKKYLKTYVAFKEDITDKNLLQQIGEGFLAFDDYAIAEDIFDDGKIRGELSIDESTIKRYSRRFNSLRHYAKFVDENNLETLINNGCS